MDTMKIIYTGEKWPDEVFRDIGYDIANHKCIFFAGPTPRFSNVVSWREYALFYLRDEVEFDGIVFTPEWRNPTNNVDFISQVGWEKDALMRCGYWQKGCILFWVPREVKVHSATNHPNSLNIQVGDDVNLTMPAFTTNVEFGRHVGCNRIVYGRPDGTPHCDYLDWMYKDVTRKVHHNNMEDALDEAIEIASR